MVARLGLGVFGAALATLIAQGIAAVFSPPIFLHRMRRYESPFQRFDWQGLQSMLQIAVPSILQQSTVSIGMLIVRGSCGPFGTQALAGCSATMRVENMFSLILSPSAMRFRRMFLRILAQRKLLVSKKVPCGAGAGYVLCHSCLSRH